MSEYKLQNQGYKVQNVDSGRSKRISKGAYVFDARVDNGVYRLKTVSNDRKRKERIVDVNMVLVRSKAQIVEDFKAWHMKLGHIGADALTYILTKGLIKGAPKFTREDLKDMNFFCNTCATTKFRRMSYRKLRGRPSQAPLHTIHMDVCGPLPVDGFFDNKRGIRYFLVLVCDFTSFKWIYFIKSKAEVTPLLMQYVDMIENQFGGKGQPVVHTWHVIKRFRADGGTEFTNTVFSDFCKGKGIRLEFSNVESHEENGGPERYNQTVMGYARSLIEMAGTKNYWWPEACAYGTYIDNRLPRKRLGWKSAYEILHKRQPNLAHAALWGSVCLNLTPFWLMKVLQRTLKCKM